MGIIDWLANKINDYERELAYYREQESKQKEDKEWCSFNKIRAEMLENQKKIAEEMHKRYSMKEEERIDPLKRIIVPTDKETAEILRRMALAQSITHQFLKDDTFRSDMNKIFNFEDKVEPKEDNDQPKPLDLTRFVRPYGHR